MTFTSITYVQIQCLFFPYSMLYISIKGGVPDLYFIFYKSISCNNLAKTWDMNLEFGMWYLYYMQNALVSTFFDLSFQKPVYWHSEILVFFSYFRSTKYAEFIYLTAKFEIILLFYILQWLLLFHFTILQRKEEIDLTLIQLQQRFQSCHRSGGWPARQDASLIHLAGRASWPRPPI